MSKVPRLAWGMCIVISHTASVMNDYDMREQHVARRMWRQWLDGPRVSPFFAYLKTLNVLLFSSREKEAEKKEIPFTPMFRAGKKKLWCKWPMHAEEKYESGGQNPVIMTRLHTRDH